MSAMHLGWVGAIAAWSLFPLRMLVDRSMQWNERRAWALACAVAPIIAYVVFLIHRAIHASPDARAA
ncbi:hypothetical protein OK348_04140 [Flavobacterium sp. MXW15]|uniref:Cardiolipin synthase N-terminal domain-containing protein n=1 Tax=Xanthomonas chitinilytica TaxID=2989819 RepID=A0ABT3JZD6_9XANT|nr:hypothetical protein [Xanthomonas sp. H13-6]MCW4453979.1 hypothetical protein [Flavobacterium sp. MXW15]MCW4473853.1 hypothetical protein [Xanthomonas sp. H13-6]